jgi:hypothetical protein
MLAASRLLDSEYKWAAASVKRSPMAKATGSARDSLKATGWDSATDLAWGLEMDWE